jgi:hypothetical protein
MSNRRKETVIMQGTDSDHATEAQQETANGSGSPFGPPLSDDVVFEAAVLRRPLHGKEQAQIAVQAADGYYASYAPTHTTTDSSRTYTEWQATLPSGTRLSGVTVLTLNAAGQIASIAIYHRPLDGALEFSREMGKRTAAALGPGYFYES